MTLENHSEFVVFFFCFMNMPGTLIVKLEMDKSWIHYKMKMVSNNLYNFLQNLLEVVVSLGIHALIVGIYRLKHLQL